MAVQYATYLRETWADLEGEIDQYRWAHTMQKLIEQEFNMAVWRDRAAEYWVIVNGREMPTDNAPLSIKVEVAGKEHGGFDLGYGTTSAFAADPTQAVPEYVTGVNAPKSGVGTRPYTIYVPYGTETPMIDDVIPYSEDAEIEIIKQADDMDDTAIVKVSKIDYFGKIIQNYTFNFEYDTTLAEIAIDGTPLESFKANKLEYNVYTANKAPIVSVTANDENADVTIEQTNTVPSTATITVENSDAPATVYTVNLGAAGGNSEEEFDDDELGEDWEIVRENASTLNLTSVPGALTITADAGDIRGNNANAQNIVLRDAPDGDWVIESKVDFSRKPTVNNEQGGIIAYTDDNNYVMLVWKMRASNGNAQQGTHAVEFVRQQGNSASPIASYYKDVSELAAGLGQDQIWLRLEKRGNAYIGYFSNNGENWKPVKLADRTQATANTNALTLNVAPEKVGVIAMNQTANVSQLPPMDVSYDYFKVSAIGELSAITLPTITREDGVATADYAIANNDPENSRNILCILVIYDNDGRLVDLVQKKVTVGPSSTVNESIEIEAGNNLVKAFIWDADTFAPLSPAASDAPLMELSE
jgi:alpha-glucuronidase